MGEKEILEGDPPAPSGGSPPPWTTGDPSPTGGQAHAPGPAAVPTTRSREDPCAGIKERQDALLAQLQGLHAQNRDATQRALRAFFGDPASATADGYAHWFTQAAVTSAVVEANNALGKTLIDVALFAMGGWGGLGELGAPASFVAKADKLFGTGLRGSTDAVDVLGKIAIKVLEKAGDAVAGYKAGKIGSTAAKTIDKWQDPKKWFQAPLSGLESVLRGSILDALGDWAKAGATSADLARATAAYADFYAAAMVANAAAAAALEVEQQLQALNAEARAKGCPEAAIPDYIFHTFDPAQFGEGASVGEGGPTMHSYAIESGQERDWDLFASVGSPGGLPF